MALRPIFKVYARETGYKGRGKLQDPWWRQATAMKQLKGRLEEILAAARECQQQESGRRGRGKGEGEEEVTDRYGLGRGAGVLVCWNGER